MDETQATQALGARAQPTRLAVFRLLVRDHEVLEHRTKTDKDIFYNPEAGLPRAERELAAAATSRFNGCIYCASVHARFAATYSKRVEDVDRLLRAGADKVGVNTAAVARPELISEIAERFGSQVLVLSVDARRGGETESGFEVTTHGGRRGTGLDAVAWVIEAERRGAGEILLNSIDADGTKDGYDLEMLRAVRAEAGVPVIASGGAGALEHFAPAVTAGADAVLAASVFHFGMLRIGEVKSALSAAGHPVR